jgi:hypothetical protein
MTRTIAIVGTGPSARHPNSEHQTTEVWGLNKAWEYMQADVGDRWFHIDDTSKYAESREFLQSFKGPVYLIYPDKTIPNSIQYPVNTVTAKMGGYFWPTASYALALALFEGCDEIHMWGLDYPPGTIWAPQRACVEYWIGRAHGMGVKVEIPTESSLLTSGKTKVDTWRRQAAHLNELYAEVK